MNDPWDPRVEVTVMARVNGERVAAKAFVDPLLWETDAFRESEIRCLKEAVLHAIGEKIHWRIEVAE